MHSSRFQLYHFIDEVMTSIKHFLQISGKGTSARDGSALAGALLENLEEKRVAGIFATHLHELFFLPLALSNTKFKRMGSETRIDGDVEYD